ncbi:TPA: phage portal protein [Streptococcus suis]|nr:phage portal protein [Streptococcus suis]
MEETLVYSRSLYDEQNLDKDIIYKLILKHDQTSDRLKKLKDYYLGKHAIENHTRRRNLPNFKTVANHAKDIADTATGYFMGNAIRYPKTDDMDIEDLLKAFDSADVDSTDSDNALNMAIYGRAYEYIYVKEGENELVTRSLEPENTFIVYDDSIEQKPLFAVYYYQTKDDVTEETYYRAQVLTENLQYSMSLREQKKESEEGVPHNLGALPIIEYRNNRYMVGDYEQQISLIDAYNSLMGNRVNDKEQAIESILVLYGAALADTPEEAKEAMEILREEGLLELPKDASAEFLKNVLDEATVEVLRKALKEDIYTFSHVPNLSDENFAGNTSGVAMEFKLLGLEMITKTKERYYIKSLHKRIQIFANYYNWSQIYENAKAIIPQFSRGLPKNLLELSQIISNLKDKVSLRQLISLLPFVEDPDAEIEALEKEKETAQEEPAFSQNLPYEESVTDGQSEVLGEAESSEDGSGDGPGRANRKATRRNPQASK